MKLKLTICLMLLCGYSFSQNDSLKIKNIFSKSQHIYSSKDFYQVDVEYKVYESSKNSKPTEFYKSIIIKSGDDYYLKIHNTEFIEIGDKSLKMNHDEKVLLLTKRQPKKNGLELINNILSILSKFKSYEVIETKETIVCEFIAPEITQLPFTKVQIYFNSDYTMKRQVLHLAQAIPLTENGKTVYRNPQLEITMSELKPYKEIGKCKLSSYMVKSQDKNKLSDKYSTYQLISKL